MLGSIFVGRERRFLALALLASLFAVLLDNWAAPALHNHSPWAGVVLFVALHVGIVALAHAATVMLAAAASESTFYSGAIASLKLLVLLPTLFLFPPSAWIPLARKYAAELVAAGIVLFTWYPSRLFETLWPHYSEWLGRFVYAVSGLFVAGLRYAPGTEPTLTGPKLDVSILFACSGLNGVRVFQILFGVLLLVGWNRLKKIRALAAYFAGLVAMLVANALRIALLVVLGNRVSADLVARFHVDAGWAFFTGVFFVFLLISYRWLLGSSPATPGVAH